MGRKKVAEGEGGRRIVQQLRCTLVYAHGENRDSCGLNGGKLEADDNEDKDDDDDDNGGIDPARVNAAPWWRDTHISFYRPSADYPFKRLISEIALLYTRIAHVLAYVCFRSVPGIRRV